MQHDRPYTLRCNSISSNDDDEWARSRPGNSPLLFHFHLTCCRSTLFKSITMPSSCSLLSLSVPSSFLFHLSLPFIVTQTTKIKLNTSQTHTSSSSSTSNNKMLFYFSLLLDDRNRSQCGQYLITGGLLFAQESRLPQDDGPLRAWGKGTKYWEKTWVRFTLFSYVTTVF